MSWKIYITFISVACLNYINMSSVTPSEAGAELLSASTDVPQSCAPQSAVLKQDSEAMSKKL